MTTRANQIILGGNFRVEEFPANAALSPGHLIERMSTSKVRKHPTAGGVSERMFATENGLLGLQPGVAATSGGITADTAYAADDRVFCAICERGARVSAYLKGGTAYAVGDKLISDGAGNLQKDTDSSAIVRKDVIAIVEEALDLSASGGVPAARGIVSII